MMTYAQVYPTQGAHGTPCIANLFFPCRLGRSEIYIMKECLKTYPATFATPHHSIFTQKFSHLISMMREGGLIAKWYNDEMEKVAMLSDEKDIVGDAEPYTLRYKTVIMGYYDSQILQQIIFCDSFNIQLLIHYFYEH